MFQQDRARTHRVRKCSAAVQIKKTKFVDYICFKAKKGFYFLRAILYFMSIGAGKTELLADRKVTRFLSHSEVYNLQKPGRKLRNRPMTYDDD